VTSHSQPVVGGGALHPVAFEGVERRLAALEDAEAAVILASGVAATACTMLALLRTGDHLIASAWLYGPTRRFFERELPTMGIQVTFIDPTELRGWRRAVQANTRVLFLESPVNPTTRVVDLRHVRHLTKEHGLALVVDSTFATPVNCTPLAHGADAVVHSATEYLNGPNTGFAGVVCGTEALIEEVREKMAVWGPIPDYASVARLERGLDTLALRIERQNASALRIARWAEERGDVRRVLYPGLPSHPDHDVAGQMFDGFGASVALTLAGGAPAADRLLKAVAVFQHTPAIGGVASSIRLPEHTTHRTLAKHERIAVGFDGGVVQLHIGLEDADELIADLSLALAS
jgi:cystathionine beta-lyase/cystathionine gamma-synthase